MASKKPSFRKKVILFFISTVYFLYWSYAFAIGTIVGVLIAAFFPLLIELVGGVFHAGEVPSAGAHWARWALTAVYWLVLFYFAVRHVRELRKREREKYALAFRLGRLYEYNQSIKAQGKGVVLRDVLEHVHGIFEPLQIAHVALHRKKGGRISIEGNEVFPPTDHPDFLIQLDEGKGVAGRVFQDSVTRYVPRMYLPSRRRFMPGIFLPHALTLQFEDVEDASGSEPALLSVDIDLYVIETPQNGQFLFRSFLSVPVKGGANGACIAVLSLDFNDCNSLKKADIALAKEVAKSIATIIHESESQSPVEASK
jgi:hypothetical protein